MKLTEEQAIVAEYIRDCLDDAIVGYDPFLRLKSEFEYYCEDSFWSNRIPMVMAAMLFVSDLLES